MQRSEWIFRSRVRVRARELGALDLLNQESEPSRITLVDASNGFNNLSRLTMMWTVWNRWPVGARFVFN